MGQPTLRQFIDIACDKYKAELVEDGPHSRYLQRTQGRVTKAAALPHVRETDELQPRVLESLCSRLGIALNEFD